MRIKTATVDGKNVAYCNETEFLVQVGRNQGAYKTRYSIMGDLAKACFYYRSLNIGNGYKKRLLVPAFNKPVLARYAS